MRLLTFALLGLFVLPGTSALAQSEDHSCDPALVRSTYVSSSAVRSDWRLSDLVDRSNYEELSHNAEGHGAIYGVPTGGSYRDYKANAQKLRTAHNESLTTSNLLNIAWTGLDPSSPSAYKTCIELVAAKTYGLHAFVVGATESDITISVAWRWSGPTGARLSWQGLEWLPTTTLADYPKEIPNGGERKYRIPRPPKQTSVVFNTDVGPSAQPIVLEPWPGALPSVPAKDTNPIFDRRILMTGSTIAQTLLPPTKVAIGNNQYSTGISLEPRGPRVDQFGGVKFAKYQLDQKFTRFSAVLGIYGSPTCGPYTAEFPAERVWFEVLVDGKVAFHEGVRTGTPVALNLDVSDVKVLSISASYYKWDYCADGLVADPELTAK